MPAPTTTEHFLTLVRKSGVVDAALLDDLDGHLGVDPQTFVTPQDLANRMVRAGVLTVLQANQLLRGRWRNFLISGKYKLLELLGSGGMGQVLLCEHARMRRRVAIKILPPDRANDPVSLRRFYREAEAVGALNHPNIVHAHDVDEDPQAHLHFLVMEYVDGSSLQEVVKKGGPLPILRACHYVRQAALGLQHAYEHGLVHRDIKPSNLLLERTGLVKILDLGLARFFHSSESLTQNLGSRSLLGTADYLAPEQALNSHAADTRSDIYSLGLTFYYLLTGRGPFPDGTVAEKLLYHQVQPPEPVQTYRPEVPMDLAAVLTRMVAKDPAERFPTPQDVVDALDAWTRTPIPPPPDAEMPRLSRASRGSDPPTMPIPRSSHSTLRGQAAPTVPTPQPAPAAWRWQPVAVAAVVAVVLLGGWVAWLLY